MQNGRQERNSSPPEARFKKGLIVAFICFYLAIQILAVLPKPQAQKFVFAPLWTAIQFIGLFQHYVVFAPPRKYNVFLEANVKLNDGEFVTWKYPRFEHLGFFDRSPKVFFRKFFNEYAHYDYNQMLWPDLARYAARQVLLQTGKKPVEVTLIRYRADIAPPQGDPVPGVPTEFKAEPFFSRTITDGDLN